MESIQLQNGASIPLTYKDGMWRTIIDGKNFIGETRHNLIRSISYLHPVVAPDEPIAPDLRSYTQQLSDILTNPQAYLSDKQAALHRLLSFALEGDEYADRILSELEQKPRPSRDALNITNLLGRSDFAFVQHEDLIEHVHNLVIRSRLINELAQRLTF